MRTDRRAADSGFTLIELLITMVVMVVVMTAITFATVTALGTTDKSQNRLLQSHDTQLVSFYLISDMNSVDSGQVFTDPTRAMPSACTSGGVPVASGSNTNLLQLQWTDKSLTSSNMYAVTYRAELVGSGPRYQIVRYFCSGTGSVTKFIVVHNLKSAVQCPAANFAVCVFRGGDTKIEMKLTTSLGGVDHVFTVTANGRTPAPAPSGSSFVLAAGSTTPAAGAANSLTITAKDSAGNTATSYSGDKALTFTGPTAVGGNAPVITDKSGALRAFGAPTTITFTNGVASVSGGNNGVMTLYKAETVNIIVTQGAINNGMGLSVTVSAGPASRLVLTAATTTPSAGSADNLAVNAVDTYGNSARSYAGDKGLTFSGAGSVGLNSPTVTDKAGAARVFGNVTTVTFITGTATVSGSNNGVMVLYKPETVNIAVTDGALNNSPGLSVTVSTGSVSRLVLAASVTTLTAGGSSDLTITAQDSSGNTVASYTGDKALTFTGPTAIGVNAPKIANKTGSPIAFGASTTIAFTNGVTSVSGGNNGVMTLYRAQTVSVVVSDGTINNGTGLSVTVNAGAAVLSFWDATGTAPTPCSSFDQKKDKQTTVTVRRDKDQYGNAGVDPNASNSVTITLSGNNGSWSPAGPIILASGVPTTGAVTWQNVNANSRVAEPTASSPLYTRAFCSFTT